MPSEPRSHLWPSAERKSIWLSFTSIGITPRLWIASTQRCTPFFRQSSPTLFKSILNPLENCTELIASSRVFESISRSISSIYILPSLEGIIFTSTPFRLRLSQGYILEGNSLSYIRRLSPSFQSSPSATMESPCEVLFTKAISSASALRSLAQFFLIPTILSTHCG